MDEVRIIKKWWRILYMMEFIQVITTIDSKEKAEEICRILLEERLAACVQIIGPVDSFYWWKGELEHSREWICLIKSSREVYGDLEKKILEHHPYEVPEIIVLPVIEGYRKYLDWLSSELKKE
ncbi:MAG: divalent-cation tolerance protein CutA [Nitrososphaerota archaeon]